jgi:uncharacterized Zn finger protein
MFPLMVTQKEDRRDGDRIVPHQCDHCGTDRHLSAATRTEFVVYFRCSQCGHIFSMQKPKVSFA